MFLLNIYSVQVCVYACTYIIISALGFFFLHGGIVQLYNDNATRSHRGHLVQPPHFAKERLKARQMETCLSFDFFFFAFQSFPISSTSTK